MSLDFGHPGSHALLLSIAFKFLPWIPVGNYFDAIKQNSLYWWDFFKLQVSIEAAHPGDKSSSNLLYGLITFTQ